MSQKEDFIELEEDIRISRQLPYTLTVEKVEGNIIYARNLWGNNVKYRKLGESQYELLSDE